MMLVGGLAIAAGASSWWVALGFGGAVCLMIWVFASASGAHFNPAVTVGFVLAGKMSWRMAGAYMWVQLLGALAAVALVAAWRPVDGVVASGTLPAWPGILVEAAATFALCYVIGIMALGPRSSKLWAGIAIGATVALGALVAGPWTGAAMNPARAFAPAAWTGAYSDLAWHVAGPFIGAWGLPASMWRWRKAEPAGAA